MAYPSTRQEMVDRLLVDRPFLIRTVVADNYPAVRDNYLAQLQAIPANVDTPEKLVQELLWWDQYQGGPDVVDPVLEVPFRASTGSGVLNSAVVQLGEMAQQAGTNSKGLITGIIALVGSLTGSQSQADAAEARAAAAAAEAAAAEARRREANARFLRIGAMVGVLLAIVLVIIYIRRRK